MLDQGNESAISWPTPDVLQRMHHVSGQLLELLQGLDGKLSLLYREDAENHPSFGDLGALAWFVSTMETDLEAIGESVASLARVRDVACPTLHL